MGRLQAEEMNELCSLEQALTWHLQSNHYPPVHLVFLPTAKKAIEKANAGEWDDVITLPNERQLTVSSIVQQLHLDSFLVQEEEF